MIPDGTSANAIVTALAGILFVFCLLAFAVFWYRLPESFRLFVGRSVNRLLKSASDVMSRESINASPSLPSSLQTDVKQTTDRRTMFVPTPAEMLDIFKVLRARGVTRDELAAPWRAAGLSLDSNLWTKAKPPESEYTTPIAGRQTRAQFDADYPYEPLN